MLAMLLGAAIPLAAAAVLIRRAVRFVRTRGRSACDSCPFSGRCRTKN